MGSRDWLICMPCVIGLFLRVVVCPVAALCIMINLLYTGYWKNHESVVCIVTRAYGTRDNTGNRLVIFSSIRCIIYKNQPMEANNLD